MHEVKGFDFLGYRFSREGLAVAPKTVEKFVVRARRLYERERGKPEGFPLLGEYVRRWVGWAGAGLACPGAGPAIRPACEIAGRLAELASDPTARSCEQDQRITGASDGPVRTDCKKC